MTDMNTWNDIIFGALARVNRCIHFGGDNTVKGAESLRCLEDCLCSGDGLTRPSAFRAKDIRTAERVLSLVGLSERVTGRTLDGDILSYRLGVNPLWMDAVHFRLSR